MIDPTLPAGRAGQRVVGWHGLTGPWRRRLDIGLRIAGWVVAVGLAAVSAIYEAFLTPLFWHGNRLPFALVLAIAGNAGLAWFTREVAGHVGAVFAPAAIWIFLIFLGADRTREGDLVLTDRNWVSLSTVFAGSLTFAIVGYAMVFRSVRR